MKGYIIKWIIFLSILMLIRFFLFEVYEVSQNSMENTFKNGARVGIQKSFYKIRREDILVFTKGKKRMIKRCIGLPGDTVRITAGATMVNGKLLPAPEKAIVRNTDKSTDLVALSSIYNTYRSKWDFGNFGPYVIPRKNMTIPLTGINRSLYRHIIEQEIAPALLDELKSDYTFRNDYYFLIGDNRYQSEDSRMFGPISKHQITGKVIIDFRN